MTAPLFSVVIPTYNRARLLKAAVESVLQQSFEDWELIVVDDGSTDETQELLQTYSDPRLFVVYQPNQGKSVARNRGAERARGAFFCFLDSDDYFLPQHLEIHAKEIRQRGKVAGVYGSGLITRSKTAESKTPFYRPDSGKNPLEFFCLDYHGGNVLNVLSFPAECFSRHRFDPRFRYFQDSHFLLRVLAEFPFFQIEQHTAVCRIHTGRSSYDICRGPDAEENVLNNVAAIQSLFQEYGHLIRPLTPPWLESYLVSSKFMDHSSSALAVGKYQLTWRLFFRALQYDKKAWFWWRYLKFLPKIPLKFLINYPSLPNEEE